MALSACSPAGTKRVLEPLPSTRTCSASKSMLVVSRSTSSSALSPLEYASSNSARSRCSSGVLAGIFSSSVAMSCGLSVFGRLCGSFGAGRRSAGLLDDLAVLEQAAEEAPGGGELARHGPRRGALLGEARGPAPQSLVIDVLRVELVRGRPGRQLGRIGPVGLPGAFGGAPSLQVGVERAQRGAPRLRDRRRTLRCRECVLHRHVNRSDRDPERAGGFRRGLVGIDLPPRPWHPVRGDIDASTLWYAVMRKETRGIFIGTLCIRHSSHHASLVDGGWQEVAPEDIDGGGSGVSPSPWTAELPADR